MRRRQAGARLTILTEWTMISKVTISESDRHRIIYNVERFVT